MRTGLRNSVWIGCGLLALCVSLWGQSALRVSAANVVVGPPASATTNVVVHICGNGVTEMGEECDPGRHCINRLDCTSNPAVCAGIGTGTCTAMSFGTCSSLCKILVGGSSTPPPTQVTITDITVRPEQRYLGGGNNYDTDFYFSLLNSDNSSHQTVIYQNSSPFSANASGVAYPYVTLPDSVVAGTYDALIKSKAHLAKLQDNFYLIAGDNSVNFTNPNNSTVIGSSTLVAGDIDGDGNSLSGFGDNVINSVDLSILLCRIGSSDPSGNTIRANLNQDGTVDQADLNILLGNLDKEGDK